jgi:hypothetical protein
MAEASTTSRRTGNPRALAALAAVLPASVDVRPSPGANQQVRVGGQTLELAWVGEGHLGDVRAVIAVGLQPDVVAARRLSPGAREALRRDGISWVDETGAAEIAIGSIVVSRSGHVSERPVKPPRWTPAVLGVAEALLCGTRGTVADTQEATGLSTGSCTNALRVLTDLGLLAATVPRGRASAREVVDRSALLGSYATAAEALRPPISLQVGVTGRDPARGVIDLGRRWDDAGLSWAATGAVAANVMAPYLTTVTTAEVFVAADTMATLDAAAATAGLRPIEGGRLTLRPFPTVAVQRLAYVEDGLVVAPWPRVYVDLRATGVRGEEAAEHLQETVDVC